MAWTLSGDERIVVLGSGEFVHQRYSGATNRWVNFRSSLNIDDIYADIERDKKAREGAARANSIVRIIDLTPPRPHFLVCLWRRIKQPFW